MTSPPTYLPAPQAKGPARGHGWSVFAAVLLLTGLVLAPVSIFSVHAKSLLTHTDTFVTTFAPLSEDPVVQNVIIDAVIDALDDSLDVSDATTRLYNDLDLSNWTRRTLAALEHGALEQAQATVSSLVQQVVVSERFAAVWEQTLRGTHTQLIATLQNDPNATVMVGTTGSIELQLGPIIADIKQRLLDRDQFYAEAIPDVQLGLPLTQKDSLGNIHTVYSLVISLGTWLPWITVTLLVAGLLSARRRRIAAIVTACSLAVAAAALGALIFIGRQASVESLAQGALPKPAVLAIYNAAVESLGNATLIVGVLALTVAVLLLLIRPRSSN